MSYSRQVFNKASEIIAKRRSEAIGNREEKYLKFVIDFPEIAQLEKEIVQANSVLAAEKALKDMYSKELAVCKDKLNKIKEIVK